MPGPEHVGRRYSAAATTVDAEGARAFAAALRGGDGGAGDREGVPPTFAAVYCLFPTLAQVFQDQDLGINLAGLIHGEQSFEWPFPVRVGDRVAGSAEIVSVEQKRGMTFVEIEVEAVREDGETVCRGRSLMIVRGGG